MIIKLEFFVIVEKVNNRINVVWYLFFYSCKCKFFFDLEYGILVLNGGVI